MHATARNNTWARWLAAIAAAVALAVGFSPTFATTANAAETPEKTVTAVAGNGSVIATNLIAEGVDVTFYVGDNEVGSDTLGPEETKEVPLNTDFLPSDVFWDGYTASGVYFDSVGDKVYVTYTPVDPEEPTEPKGPPANAGPPEGKGNPNAGPPPHAGQGGPPADNPGKGKGRNKP